MEFSLDEFKLQTHSDYSELYGHKSSWTQQLSEYRSAEQLSRRFLFVCSFFELDQHNFASFFHHNMHIRLTIVIKLFRLLFLLRESIFVFLNYFDEYLLAKKLFRLLAQHRMWKIKIVWNFTYKICWLLNN